MWRKERLVLEIIRRSYKNLRGRPWHFILLIAFASLLSSCNIINRATIQDNHGGMTLLDHKSAQRITFEALYFDAIKADLVEDNASKAIYKLQRCLDMQPKNPAVLFKLAEVYLKNGRYADAEKKAEKAVSIDDDNKWYLLLLSDIYKVEKKYDEATEIYEKLIKLYPENYSFYLELSNLYVMEKELDKAVSTLDDLEEKVGITPQIILQKKNLYLSMNKLDKAVAEVNKLIELNPENTEYIRMLIDLYLANGKDNKVPALYEKIIEIDSNDGRAQLVMAEYYMNQGNTEKAGILADRVFNNPEIDFESKMTFLVFNYFNKGINKTNKDRALELAGLLVKHHPDNPRGYAIRGDIYSKLNENEKALSDYKAALDNEKSMMLLWQKVLSMSFETKDYDEIIKLSEEGKDYFPASHTFYLFRGTAFFQKKDYENAIKEFSAGLDFVIDNADIRKQFYVNLAESYNHLQNHGQSDLYFEKALEIDPDDPLVLNNYAYYLSLRKVKLKKAKELSARSLEVDSDNAAYLDTYGWIMYLMGNFEEAEKYIGKALESRSWDPDLLEHYGDVLFKLGRIDEAVQKWEKAKKKGSVSEKLDKKISDRKLYE